MLLCFAIICFCVCVFVCLLFIWNLLLLVVFSFVFLQVAAREQVLKELVKDPFRLYVSNPEANPAILYLLQNNVLFYDGEYVAPQHCQLEKAIKRYVAHAFPNKVVLDSTFWTCLINWVPANCIAVLGVWLRLLSDNTGRFFTELTKISIA